MLLDEIKSYLVSQGVTEPIYLGEIPDQPDNVVGLFEYAGSPPEFAYGVEIERPGLQVRVRNTSYPVGRQLLQDIQNLLHGLRNITINGTHYTRILANQGVTPLGRDDLNRMEWVQNYSISKEGDR